MRKWSQRSELTPVYTGGKQQKQDFKSSHLTPKPTWHRWKRVLCEGPWGKRISVEGQLCDLGRGKEGEVERANVDCYCKEGRGTHRSWKGTQEWQKPFCVFNEQVWSMWTRYSLFTSHPRIAKKKNEGVGWEDMRVTSNSDSTIPQLQNSSSVKPDGIFHSITLAGKMI